MAHGPIPSSLHTWRPSSSLSTSQPEGLTLKEVEKDHVIKLLVEPPFRHEKGAPGLLILISFTENGLAKVLSSENGLNRCFCMCLFFSGS